MARKLSMILFFGCAVGGLAQVNDGDLHKLSREERVRLLKQRTWEITAAPLEGDFRFDGLVEEAAWDAAQPIDNFYQNETNEGLPATERTEVRVLYDQRNLYIGIQCYDREPDKWTARGMFRDDRASADDLVSVMLDSYNDKRSAIQLVTNASGLLIDFFQTGETRDTRNENWDMVWDSRGAPTAEGWSVEIVIPFKSLRFEPPVQNQELTFGIGFKRNIPRKNEEVYWPFVGNDSTWYRPAELGKLHGLRGIESSLGLEIRPYVLGGVVGDYELNRTDGRADAGGDLKWGVTSGLTADFTLNTDFAQEEADVQQINFTRFSLFFPEKRQFFLEGEQMFQFGIPSEADLIFTRRIGLSEEGEAIPILVGARLSGRQGPYTIGAMSIQTGETGDESDENFTVLRVKRDIASRSSVGALLTSRQGDGGFNRVFGADLNLFFRDVWLLQGYFAGVDEPGTTAGSHSLYARFAYDTDLLGVNYRYLDIGENFSPGVGFVRRPDSRENSAELRFSPRPATEWIRQFDFTGSLRYVTNQENDLETRVRAAEFMTQFESGDAVAFRFENLYESIDESFTVGGFTIAPGPYRFSTFESRLSTFRRRHGSLDLSYKTGGFWTGDRDTLEIEPGYRINRHFDISGKYQVNWVDLAQGSFATQLLSSRVQVAFRNNMALLSLFQYNSSTNLFSSNIRFHWIPKLGTDFFVVYNETDEINGSFSAKNRSLSVKLNYLFAF